MIRHLVLWSFKDGLTAAEKAAHTEKIKAELEALPALIPGIVSLRVITAPLADSNRDLMLDSLFETEEMLDGYQTHPEHLRVATFIRSVVQDRVCMDFEE